MRGLLAIIFIPLMALAQAPQLTVQPVYPTSGPDTRNRIDYSIMPAKSVTAAWIEVWDRPKLLYRTRVEVSEHGHILMPDYEEPDDLEALKIAIYDPQVLSYCIDFCGDDPGPSHGETVSETVIGVSDPQYWDRPELDGAIAQRIASGVAPPELLVMGHGFSSETGVLLVEERFQGDLHDGTFVHTVLAPLHAEFVDMCRLRVTLPSGDVLQPAHLYLYATDQVADDSAGLNRSGSSLGDRAVSLYVAKADSPVIEKVGPVREGNSANERIVTVWGRNFSARVTAHLGRDPNSFSSSRIDTEVVSPTELQLRFDGDPRFAPQPWLWLLDDDDETGVSEPVELGPEANGSLKRDPEPGLICSVDPYPFEPLQPSAPKFVELRVRGYHFRPDDTVVVRGEHSGDDVKLNTTFVSKEELLASFPRDLWREHKISFRLLVRAGGRYYDAEMPDTD